MIVGDWLPYKVFDDAGIYLIKTTLEGLKDKIEDVITHYEMYKEKSMANKENVYNLSSWKGVTQKWVSIYTECLNLRRK